MQLHLIDEAPARTRPKRKSLSEAVPASTGRGGFITWNQAHWPVADHVLEHVRPHATAELALAAAEDVDSKRRASRRPLWARVLVELGTHGQVVKVTPLGIDLRRAS